MSNDAAVLPKENSAAAEARQSSHHWWWLVVLLIVCTLGVSIGQDFKHTANGLLPETLPVTSTFNEKASGYSALYELAEKCGLTVSRWQQPYRNLKDSKQQVSGTLVMIGPWDAPSGADADRISNFVARGNTLIYLDDFSFSGTRSLLAKFQASVEDPDRSEKLTVAVEHGVAEKAHTDKLKLVANGHLTGGESLIADKKGGVFIRIKYGKGQCLICTAPSMCANIHINDPDYRSNFQFLINCLRSCNQPIMFDETCHGFSSATNVFIFVLHSPVGLLIAQVLLIVLVAFVSFNHRFGRPVSVHEPRKISNLEFIDGLSRTYQMARARSAVWSMLFHPFKVRLCKNLSVSKDGSNEQLAQSWAELHGGSLVQYQDFLMQSQAGEDKELSQNELIALVESLDRLDNGLKDGKSARNVKGA